VTGAEAFLADEYEQSKAEVQRTVAAKLGAEALAGIDLDAAYNEAWHALYLLLERGESVDNHKGFLVTVAYRRALSERRAGRLEYATDSEELAWVGVEPDLDARLDAEMQLRHFVQGLRAALSERELQAATLCHLHGLSRREAAKLLGIAPRRMEKLMDRASKRISAVIGAVRPGELCDEFDSMVRAFAVGMLDETGERYQLARDHLESCPACRRKVLTLRGLGAITPPLPALLGLLTGAAGVGATQLGAGAAKGGLAKGSLGKVASLSPKAALVGGTVAATTAVAAVAAVAVVGGGKHHAPAPQGAQPAPVVGAAVAGEEAAAAPSPARHAPRKHAHHRAKRKSHPRHRHADESKPTPAPATTAPPTETEATADVAPPPEPAPEPPPAPAPEPAPEPTESQPPLKDASVEFELH